MKTMNFMDAFVARDSRMSNTKKIIQIAEDLKKDNKEISISSFKQCAKDNEIDIKNLNYGTIVKTLEKRGYEFNKVFDKNKFSQRRIEMALLTHQGWTLQKIADKYGITKQAVSLLLKKAAAEDNQIVVKSKRTRSDPHEKNVIFIKRSRKPKNICKICSKEFYGKNKTCSSKCLRKLNDEKIGGEWSRIEKIELECSYCSNKFQRTKYIQKVTEKAKGHNINNYCSRECYHKSRKNPVQGVLSGN